MEDDFRQSTVVLCDVREKCKDALTHIQGLIKKAEYGEFDTSKVSPTNGPTVRLLSFQTDNSARAISADLNQTAPRGVLSLF